MNKMHVTALIIGILLLGGIVIKTAAPSPELQAERPTDEAAELTAFGFIQDFIASAPPSSDTQALNRAYEALSQRARQVVSSDTISRDLAGFIGVQDIPDQGASVDIKRHGNTDRGSQFFRRKSITSNYCSSGKRRMESRKCRVARAIPVTAEK